MDAFHSLDGLVKKLEELEKTAELYKGSLFFTIAKLNSLIASNSPACSTASSQNFVGLVGLMEHTKRLLRAFFELSQSHRGKSLRPMLLLAAVSNLLDWLTNLPFQPSGTSFLLSACESHRQQPVKLLSNSPMLTVTLRNTVFSFSRPSSQ